MPIIESPAKEAPMKTSKPKSEAVVIITEQPEAEPCPQLDDGTGMGLRGGNLNLGCTCCHGSCSFYKSCC
ncbi:hypothetical protein VTK73DRAFT_1472 [Phialemonium thermophilum]|uniref:Uncharacterized protein n=1 Tax=Phialemonium thermophilum TaxID=223376 RepID=A0ABR3X9Y5_9PEZI